MYLVECETVNAAGLTHICAGLCSFIVSKVKSLYPRTYTRTRTHTYIDSIKYVSVGYDNIQTRIPVII